MRGSNIRGRQKASQKRKTSPRLNRTCAIRFELITLFPETFDGFCCASLIGKAVHKGLISIHRHNPRDWATKTRQADDRPYGGGPGMVLMPEPLYQTLSYIKQHCLPPASKGASFILSPRGQRLSPKIAKNLAKLSHLTLLAGHYEGIDERIHSYVDGELSIGDYVTMGGETAAMVVIEAVARHAAGVMQDPQSLQKESFSIENHIEGGSLLEWPQYTRPQRWKGREVPKVLLSGDHAQIASWRASQARRRTLKIRPDLIK